VSATTTPTPSLSASADPSLASASALLSKVNSPGSQLANIPQSVDQAVAHGNNLIAQIQSGPAGLASLAAAGIAFETSIAGPQYQQFATLAMDVLGGALAGASVAGPYGAALGAAVGLVEGLADVGEFEGVEGVGGVSAATETITSRVLSLAATKAGVSDGLPAGWHMADYLATVYPPTTTKRAGTWQSLVTSALATDLEEQGSPNYSPQWIAWVASSGTGGYQLSNVPSGAYASGFGPESAVCTPVWFNWSTPTATGPAGLHDCSFDLYFGEDGAGAPAAELKKEWIAATFGVSSKLTQDVIVANAIARRPDPLYFGTSLYGFAFGSQTLASGGAFYRNPDGFNATLTVLVMLSVGASPMSILSELSIQAAILKEHGDVFGTTATGYPGTSTPNAGQPFQLGTPGKTLQPLTWSMQQAQATLHQLILDYAAMATALAHGKTWTGPEMWGSNAQPPPAPEPVSAGGPGGSAPVAKTSTLTGKPLTASDVSSAKAAVEHWVSFYTGHGG
jgi:hypothetical protein